MLPSLPLSVVCSVPSSCSYLTSAVPACASHASVCLAWLAIYLLQRLPAWIMLHACACGSSCRPLLMSRCSSAGRLLRGGWLSSGLCASLLPPTAYAELPACWCCWLLDDNHPAVNLTSPNLDHLTAAHHACLALHTPRRQL